MNKESSLVKKRMVLIYFKKDFDEDIFENDGELSEDIGEVAPADEDELFGDAGEITPADEDDSSSVTESDPIDEGPIAPVDATVNVKPETSVQCVLFSFHIVEIS